MTTNKQDPLTGKLLPTKEETISALNSYQKMRRQDDLRSAYPIRTFRGVTQDELVELVNCEVSQVLTDLLEHRSLLSDPQHGEKSVPVSVIKAKLREYESE